MSREKGDPYTNLALAVLGEAKKGNKKMWKDFKKEYGLDSKPRINIEPREIAAWVGAWLQRHFTPNPGALLICPRCKIKTYKGIKCDICDSPLEPLKMD